MPHVFRIIKTLFLPFKLYSITLWTLRWSSRQVGWRDWVVSQMENWFHNQKAYIYRFVRFKKMKALFINLFLLLYKLIASSISFDICITVLESDLSVFVSKRLYFLFRFVSKSILFVFDSFFYLLNCSIAIRVHNFFFV